MKGVYLLCALVLAAALGTPPAAAGPCDEFLAKIKAERRMMKKKQVLAEALQACPDDARINYQYGFSLERFRKYEEAVTYYRKAAELDPKTGKHFFGLADSYMVLGQVETAINAYQRGLKVSPGDLRAQHALELAVIKRRAEVGEQITTDEFVKVMTESEAKSRSKDAADGPILRMQILFQRNSSVVDDASRAQLSMVGQALGSDALGDQRFEIAGHTDDSGEAEYNLQLSKRRAEAVKRLLIKQYGIAEDRIQVAYYGETLPVAPNTSFANRVLNRRVEFRRLDNP